MVSKLGWAMTQVPEEFFKREHSATAQAYLWEKYSKYGYRKGKPIEYNREYTPEDQKRFANIRHVDKFRWVENVSRGLRFVGMCQEICKRIDHNGWFTDSTFQDEVIYGVVYQLPTRHGELQYDTSPSALRGCRHETGRRSDVRISPLE